LVKGSNGLSLSNKNLVSRMDGNRTVFSKTGKGATQASRFGENALR